MMADGNDASSHIHPYAILHPKIVTFEGQPYHCRTWNLRTHYLQYHCFPLSNPLSLSESNETFKVARAACKIEEWLLDLQI